MQYALDVCKEIGVLRLSRDFERSLPWLTAGHERRPLQIRLPALVYPPTAATTFKAGGAKAS